MSNWTARNLRSVTVTHTEPNGDRYRLTCRFGQEPHVAAYRQYADEHQPIEIGNDAEVAVRMAEVANLLAAAAQRELARFDRLVSDWIDLSYDMDNGEVSGGFWKIVMEAPFKQKLKTETLIAIADRMK